MNNKCDKVFAKGFQGRHYAVIDITCLPTRILGFNIEDTRAALNTFSFVKNSRRLQLLIRNTVGRRDFVSVERAPYRM